MSKKIIFSILAFSISALILIGFFMFPRNPQIIVSQPYINTAPSLTATLFTIFLNISVISKNYIDYHINSLHIDTNITNFNIIGSGEIDNQNIKSMAVTTLIVPIVFNFTSYNKNTVCGFNGDTTNYLNLEYSIIVNINVISTFYTPVIQGKNSIMCPFK